ncbi:MAG: hybrid sensor histidine kinase/response regulator [Planctomycetota bacterium]|nr:hybrid sensor histidine kinase/response regulator [Planctomycetota bacterium]
MVIGSNETLLAGLPAAMTPPDGADHLGGIMAITLVVGPLVGVVLGWWLRSLRPDRVPGTASPSSSENWTPESLEDRSLGFIRVREDGSIQLSRGLAGVLAGLESSEEPPDPSRGIDAWAAAVVPEDRHELASMLGFRPVDEDMVLQLRIDGVHGEPDDRRWFSARRLRGGDGCGELLLEDQTAEVASDRRRVVQLRNERLLARVGSLLSDAESLDEVISTVLLEVGSSLDLVSGSSFAVRPGSEGMAWMLQTAWRSSPEVELEETLELSSERVLDEIAQGRPVMLDEDRSDRILVPIVVNGRAEQLMLLATRVVGLWDPDTFDCVGRISETLGRIGERQVSEQERETWAATRGSLERSESVARLTSGVAHDFNGVLFAVLGRFELLRRRITDREVLHELDLIADTLQEAKRLGDRLRQATRPAGDPVPINARMELDEIADAARRLLPKRLSFEAVFRIPEATSPVELVARADTLQQVLFNLLVNARNAVGVHGRIQLGARLLADDELEVRVDDDGPGIPADQRERMLEPYETGEQSEGVGLGLAVCQRIAEEAGGRLMLEDSPLGGLAARVVFPVRVSKPGRAATDEVAAAGPDAEPGTPRHALILEDNPVIREVLTEVLREMGARVESRGHAVGVEGFLESNPDIDLLVFDIDLPERTGRACLEELRAEGVDIPCVLITGGASEPPRVDRTAFLRKPFRIETLRESISSLLG